MSRPNERSKAEREEYLRRLRHSAAHVMAYAVQQLFEDGEKSVKLAIGPSIENEFYYDMEVPRAITPADFPEIEKHMRAFVKANVPFEQESWLFEQAREWFAQHEQKFKLELIDGIADAEALGCLVFHAGTKIKEAGKYRDSRMLTNGGRVLAVTGLGKRLGAARHLAYGAWGSKL